MNVLYHNVTIPDTHGNTVKIFSVPLKEIQLYGL